MPLPRTIGLVVALGLFAPSSASAQSKSDAAAQAVFEDGLAKFERGEFAAACPLLQRAVQISSTPALGGMLTLAECYEKTGRPASAWGLYKKVAALANADGKTDRADKARKAAERLEPTLPRVKFVRKGAGEAPAGLSVKYGDEVVPADLWDVALPVDPGTLRFTFEADGRSSTTRSAEVPKGASVTEVPVPDLEPASRDTSRAPPPTLVSTPPPLEIPEGASGQKGGLGAPGIAGIVVGAVGIVGVAASIGVIVDAKGKWKEAVAHDCGGNASQCSTLAGIDAARGQGDAATAVFGVGIGLAAIGTGILIYDLARHAKKDSAGSASTTFAFGAMPDPRGGGSGFATVQWRSQ